MATDRSIRVKVAGAQQQDVGKGIVRIALEHICSLGLERGGVIEIKGSRAGSTSNRCGSDSGGKSKAAPRIR